MTKTQKNGIETRLHGIVLGTKRFEECVAFYRDVVCLPLWFEKPDLSCFRFGNCYLMIETEQAASDFTDLQNASRTLLRFNVDSVLDEAEKLKRKGVDVDVKVFDWGTVGTFRDPDGNPCELKNADDRFFL